MAEKEPNKSNRFDDLMRNAGARRRELSARMIETERRFRIESKRKRLTGAARVDEDMRRHAEQLELKVRIKNELKQLEMQLKTTSDTEERIMLKAEIAHLHTLKANLGNRPPRSPRRKPPEAGIPVPAVPPKGPLPKQGGAEAPLDFDAGENA